MGPFGVIHQGNLWSWLKLPADIMITRFESSQKFLSPRPSDSYLSIIHVLTVLFDIFLENVLFQMAFPVCLMFSFATHDIILWNDTRMRTVNELYTQNSISSWDRSDFFIFHQFWHIHMTFLHTNNKKCTQLEERLILLNCSLPAVSAPTCLIWSEMIQGIFSKKSVKLWKVKIVLRGYNVLTGLDFRPPDGIAIYFFQGFGCHFRVNFSAMPPTFSPF